MSSEIRTILTRLQLCQADIGTITTSYDDPPRDVKQMELPLSYCVFNSFSDLPTDPKSDVQVYTFTIEVLVKWIDDKNINTSGISQGVTLTTNIIDDVAEYYRNHRTLSTNALDTLAGVYVDSNVVGIRFNGSMEIPLPAHDGKDYIGARFQINVPMLIDTEQEY